jgi:hypothetical protein
MTALRRLGTEAGAFPGSAARSRVPLQPAER